MTLSQLRTFALVARLGSLHAAAETLGVSEPAVSSALTALRQDLGDPLFVRAAGGIALTPGGRALADYAQDIVGLADQARWEVSNATERRRTAEDRFDRSFCRTCGGPAAGPVHQAGPRRLRGCGGGVRGGPWLAPAGTRLRHCPRCPADGDCRYRGYGTAPGVRSVPALPARPGGGGGASAGPAARTGLRSPGCWTGPGLPGPRGSRTARRKAAGWRRRGWRRRSSGSAARRKPWRR